MDCIPKTLCGTPLSGKLYLVMFGKWKQLKKIFSLSGGNTSDGTNILRNFEMMVFFYQLLFKLYKQVTCNIKMKPKNHVKRSQQIHHFYTLCTIFTSKKSKNY